MTPKEKAEELIGKFRIYATSRGEDDGYCESTRAKASKQCALLCVDEIIKNQPYDMYTVWQCDNIADYWGKVKQEIEEL